MSNPVIVATLTAALLFATPKPKPAPQPAPASGLPATLAKLDAASTKFKSAQADFHKDDFLFAFKDHTPSAGRVYIIRSGSSVEAGFLISGKSGRIATYKGGVLKDYTPGPANCYNKIDSSQNKGKTESFLTLGFGGSGTELAKNWTITDLGPETVEGVKTEKLDLVSKDPGVRQNFSKVTLWMDLDRDVSIKQQFFAAATGDINTATYTNIHLNSKVDTKPFEIKGNACK